MINKALLIALKKKIDALINVPNLHKIPIELYRGQLEGMEENPTYTMPMVYIDIVYTSNPTKIGDGVMQAPVLITIRVVVDSAYEDDERITGDTIEFVKIVQGLFAWNCTLDYALPGAASCQLINSLMWDRYDMVDYNKAFTVNTATFRGIANIYDFDKQYMERILVAFNTAFKIVNPIPILWLSLPVPALPTTFSTGQTRQRYIQLTNVGTMPTVGIITLRLSKPTNFSGSVLTAMTTADGIAVDNAIWTITSNTFYWALTSRSNMILQPGASYKIGFSLAALGGPGSNANIVYTILNSSANPDINTITETLTII
jgi:hypothetical protein